ncbi:FG-GAP-like repeat-containing protein [Streptacidiphilus cavernicola]|uniref:FG-GAP-like repeat-containing protein n=1 Tax=Streptacidiphilus cavernicola TaxID=3342716 RepID=A0ABV6VZZ2_9ACTN
MLKRTARILAAGTALLGVLAGTLTGATTASASSVTGSRCPNGDFCLFSGAGGTGTVSIYHSSQSDFGTAGTKARSWANRTTSYATIFPGTGYSAPAGSKYGSDSNPPAEGADEFAWGDTSVVTGMTGHVGSVRLAPTGHEADTGQQYIDWYSPQVSSTPTPHSFGSFLGDGQSELLMRSVEGNLWRLDVDGSVKNLGTGWNGMTALVRHGDFNGDGREDVIARDAKGNLWLYPGNAQGTLSSRHPLGVQWNGMTALVGIGDLTGDGRNDLVARDAKGNLWIYPGNAQGTLSSRHALGTGWNGMTSLVGAGDLNGDGRPDLAARDSKGNLWLYPGTATGVLGARHLIISGVPQSARFFAVGDVDGDGRNDLYSVTAPVLSLFSGTGKGTLTHSRTAWNQYMAIDPRELYF